MFPEVLRKLRRDKKLSQGALARELDITQQAVGKWETGRSQPDPEMLRRLADFFSVSADFLLGQAPHGNASPVPAYSAAGEHPIPVVGTAGRFRRPGAGGGLRRRIRPGERP